jgi:hypothetical protein
VLAAQGKLEYRTFLFCNVGADSENPDTLTYVERIAKPYAQAHGLLLEELHTVRNGKPITLYGLLTRPDSRSIGIPVRMSNEPLPEAELAAIDRWRSLSNGSSTKARRTKSYNSMGESVSRLVTPLALMRCCTSTISSRSRVLVQVNLTTSRRCVKCTISKRGRCR